MSPLPSNSFANTPALWRDHFPAPSLEGHKYTRGHALVLSGGPTQTGAARLAARGALRVGAGLVTVLSPANALIVNACHLTAIMLRRCDGPDELAALLDDPRFNAVALGPALGVGRATRNYVRTVCDTGRALVLDADGITSFEGEAECLSLFLSGLAKHIDTHPPNPKLALAPRVKSGDDTDKDASVHIQAVITPHEGEFARLFKGYADILDAPSKLERARKAASFLRSVVVLKGPDTVIAAPDGRAAINANAPPWLATAGSGDVLTGLITGLIAQGMPTFEAACAGVWLHGEAATLIGRGLIAEDLPEKIPVVLAMI